MAKHGKGYLEAAKKVDSTRFYPVDEAMKLVEETSYVDLDATIEVAYNLSIDPEQADQQIRGALVLPNDTGKSRRVVTFAEGPQADQAKETGVGEVGSDDLVEKVQNGYLDFDMVITTPMMMTKVGHLDHISGPRGLIPGPKVSAVTMDVAKAVENQKAGQVEHRVDKRNLIRAPVGKASLDADGLVQNFNALRGVILRTRPASTKGQHTKSVAASVTFDSGAHLDPLNLDQLVVT